MWKFVYSDKKKKKGKNNLQKQTFKEKNIKNF